MRTSARPARWRATMCCATCSASSSTRNDSPITTSSIASSKSSGNRDMWTPFCAGSRSTVQSIVAGISFSVGPQRSRIAFRTPVTPARESPSWTSGSEACRSSVRKLSTSMAASEDTFARLVSLAVHDLRTPLATISGFARTLQRADLAEPNDRYLDIMVAASDQLAELLEDLGLAARIESDRWEPNVQEADTAELAHAASEGLAAEVEGNGVVVRVDRDAAERSLHLLARCAIRHGGVERVTFSLDGPAIAIDPVSPAAAPVLTRETLRDLGAAVGARAIEALGGSVELEDARLVVRLPS